MPIIMFQSPEGCRKAMKPLLAVAGLFLLAAMPAWGTTTYQNVAASSGTFNTEAGNQGVVLGSLMTFATLDLNDVGGTGVNFTPLIGTASLSGTSILNSSISSGSGFQITITNPVAAFGFEFTNSSTSGMQYCIQVDGGSSCAVTDYVSSPQIPFFGWVSDTPFTGTITLTKTNFTGQLQINNFQVGTLGTTTEAPEPGTMLLMGGSLILFPLLSRRYRRRRR